MHHERRTYNMHYAHRKRCQAEYGGILHILLHLNVFTTEIDKSVVFRKATKEKIIMVVPLRPFSSFKTDFKVFFFLMPGPLQSQRLNSHAALGQTAIGSYRIVTPPPSSIDCFLINKNTPVTCFLFKFYFSSFWLANYQLRKKGKFLGAETMYIVKKNNTVITGK